MILSLFNKLRVLFYIEVQLFSLHEKLMNNNNFLMKEFKGLGDEQLLLLGILKIVLIHYLNIIQ